MPRSTWCSFAGMMAERSGTATAWWRGRRYGHAPDSTPIRPHTNILRETGAAKGESGLEVRLGDVQLSIHPEDPHHLLGISPERIAEIRDLVGEAHLQRVKRIADILHHLRRSHGRLDEGRIDSGVQRPQCVRGVGLG